MSLQVVIFRLVISLVLSGLIGIEREDKNRPAGFKTHILVCVASTMVMLTSEYVFNVYSGRSTMDPARLGAQVISGIGFLGAGTIIRQGTVVKGLTTAASLWAVACIGLAVGIGFYEGAIAGALLIYFTLVVLSRLGHVFQDKTNTLYVIVGMDNYATKVSEISFLLSKYQINIRNIELLEDESDTEGEEGPHILVKLNLRLPHRLAHSEVINRLNEIKGIDIIEHG